MVSVALLLIFFAAIAAIFDVVTSIVGESRTRTIGTALAAEKMEVVRNLPYTSIGTQGGIPDGVLDQTEIVHINGQDFTVATTILYIDDPFDDQVPVDLIGTDYKRVRISITWGGAFPSTRPVVLTTDVVPDGLETNEGGGTLSIHVIDSNGLPVSNAQVSIENSSVTPAVDWDITTNTDGTILIPGAEACADCYKISVTKNDYSTDRTYALSEVDNPIKPDATVLEGELTSLTFSIDQTVTINVETRGPRSSNYPPFAGVQFNLRGSEVIGTNALDEPVYKYDKTLATATGGRLTLEDMEPDTYEVTIPAGSTVDFAGSAPISPFLVLPGVDRTLLIVTEPATTNNLLVVIQNLSGDPVSGAATLISRDLIDEASGTAAIAGDPDNGQLFFKNLVAGTYQVYATQSGYISASGSATVAGDSLIYLVMENE